MTDLSNIIERLEKATGPCRELDVRVYVACGLGNIDLEHGDHFKLNRADGRRTLHVFTSDGRGPYRSEEAEDVSGMVGWDVFSVPPYTASLDAAIALVEAKLGTGSFVDISTITGKGSHHCKIYGPAAIGDADNASSPSIAVLIAMFRALREQKR